MRIVIFGSTGQLGSDLVRTLSDSNAPTVGQHETIKAPRALDICHEGDVHNFLQEVRPDWVINCAAFTNVDLAQTQPNKALMVNSIGAAIIAQSAESLEAGIVHISTEAVYRGDSPLPYTEADRCDPVSIYGVSKMAGDQAVSQLNSKALIVRPSWLYTFKPGTNFPTRILQQLRATTSPIQVVDDIRGNPTPVATVSGAIVAILNSPPEPGTYNVACSGLASKYEWAQRIAALAGYSEERILHTESSLYPSLAKRPLRVDLSCEKFEKLGLIRLPNWLDACTEAAREAVL